MKSKYTKYQWVAITCLAFVILACVINSILVTKYKLYGDDNGGFLMGVPFFAMTIFIFTYCIYVKAANKSIFNGYVKTNYPEIWGQGRYPPLQMWRALLRGKLDDGTDETLNQIKLEAKRNENIRAGAFLSVLVLWIFNLFLFVHYQR